MADEAEGGTGRTREDEAAHGAGRVVDLIQLALEAGPLTREGLPALVRQIYEILVRDRDHGHGGSYQAGGAAS